MLYYFPEQSFKFWYITAINYIVLPTCCDTTKIDVSTKNYMTLIVVSHDKNRSH